MNAQRKKNGFTIIEVVLVLAIAGLIFLMVFIALPALQRNQRDTQRRTDLGQFVSQLQSFSTNNNNKFPASTADTDKFVDSYLAKGDSFKDPVTATKYTVQYGVGSGVPTSTDAGAVLYGGPDTKCGLEKLEKGGGARQAAVVMRLEGSGIACQQVQR